MHAASVSHRGSIGTGAPQTFGHKELQKFTGAVPYRSSGGVLSRFPAYSLFGRKSGSGKNPSVPLIWGEPVLVKKYSVLFVKLKLSAPFASRLFEGVFCVPFIREKTRKTAGASFF